MWTHVDLPLALICFCVCLILPSTAEGRASDLTDVVLAQVGSSITLPCSSAAGAHWVAWVMMSTGESHWTTLLSVNASGEPTGTFSRHLAQLDGRIFEMKEDAALQFIVTAKGGGRYSCSMRVDSQKLEERVILLAVVKLTITPSLPIPMDSIVQLEAEVSPHYAIAEGVWLSPTGTRLLTTISSAGTFLTKLPRVTANDNGLYTCSIQVRGRSSKPVYNYTLAVAVDERQVAPLPNMKYGPMRSAAVLSEQSVTLPCPPVLGDYVRIYWWRPDVSRNARPEVVFCFDRWRNRKKHTKTRLQLRGRSSPGHTGNTSFVLKPALADAGRYQCEVFLDNEAFGQVTTLTVLRGYSSPYPSSLNLRCEYTERSQVLSVEWSHVQRPALHLMQTAVIGRVTATVPLPVTPDTAGQYACTMRLKSGQVISYLHSLRLPPTERPCCVPEPSGNVNSNSPGPLLPPAEGNSVSEPSVLLPSLSLLLFLVPVTAVAVGLLLWRRGSCTLHRNVECTLSHYSGEVENIYENPEDLRQSAPRATEYMDLKPIGQMDVYGELDRYDQC